MTKRSPSKYEDMTREELIDLLKKKDEVILNTHEEIMKFCEGDVNLTLMINSISHSIQQDVNDFIKRYDYSPNQ